MYRTVQQSLLARIQAILAEKYEITLANLAVEQPPSIALGELALPVAFELAKRLRKAPRAIATELAAELSAALPEGVGSIEVAGAGYLNVRLKRSAVAQEIARDRHADIGGAGFRLVEHTSINPNKAAHIGHLRNAILGDTFQRLLRSDDYKSGYEVGVQNYIDNTGVQVADVVVGLVHREGLNLAGVRKLLVDLSARGERIDFYCWDLYARVSQWYTADADEAAARKQLRLETLHAIEHGGNETAEIADLIATAVLRRHLETMERLSIEYDFLPRESEILHLHFWDAARQLMVEKGVLYFETAGKNKGCWVMRRAPVSGSAEASSEQGSDGPDEDAKVIVRSNGTVTYVGKDIAYHLWKFGLLPGKDFGYRKFHEYASHTCWISTEAESEPGHPVFGRAEAIYNVIDSRQNDPQTQVVQALRGMGFTDEADRYTHFSYEMVALTPRCALDLGYTVSEEDQKRAYIEVSGRKGFGVKADDLLDQLIAAARTEVDARHPDLGDSDRDTIARQIGVGALRYFMLRYTRNTVIAFDFKDALSFEGETGPYIQYAIVRAANIFRKANTTEEASLAAFATLDLKGLLDSEEGTTVWETWLLAAKLTLMIEQCISTSEPAYLARYAFQLAQQFNNFYHRHHILNETDPTKRGLYLATAAVAQREMVRALGYLGIEAPERM
ncbi:arginine--tRNA ligase [Edaphobacter modestus]|uniref:arginine--tRNA ligase n=1 Tax=Edaphobacter modestus TaxID=388466 RepID=A0A4Q7YR37_9BACT|nr:DALR anticodon-binding domain-containing protein [Edaphobacter modestus]RZU39634.1 arginyl-tRNA synthetase [Edaphobacter modestus]